jgi:diguanylate cyclase (GGDEF)-like protein
MKGVQPSVRRSHRALAAGALSCAALLAFPRGGIAQTAVFLLTQATAATLLVLRVRFEREESARVWRWMAAGQIVYLLATVPWYSLPVMFGRPVPFPSIIDFGYFASYLLFAVFLVKLVGQRSPGESRVERRLAMLDAGIFTAAMSSVLWVAVIEPNVRQPGLPAIDRAVALAYPMFVAVLFALAMRLFVGSSRGSVPETLLMLWVGGELAADILYGYQSANGTFSYGSPFSVLWLMSYAAVAALALHPRFADLSRPTRTRTGSTGTRLTLLFGAAAVPLTLAGVAVSNRATGQATALLAAAGLTFLLVIVRVSLIAGDLAEQRRLARELERLSDELRHSAFHDSLTGLGNRALLMDRLGQALRQRPQRAGLETALLLLDLDGFKTVNDTLGHEAGDELLCDVAERLVATLRASDTVVRLGGDEFAVILEQLATDHLLRTAKRVLDVLRAPVTFHGRQHSARGSIGICVAGDDDDPRTILRNADLAMYAAKAHGGDRYELFHAELHRAFIERHELELRLRDAAELGELRLHYQPVIDLVSGTVVGAEALVRWQHPTRGLLYPDSFIHLAEDSGAVIAIGHWVLREACRQLHEWSARGIVQPVFQLAVNVSRRQLLDPQIVDDVASILAATGTKAENIGLEVTESALTTDTELLVRTLQRLSELGVTIAMDDFGTGYSSLEQLRRLPIDVLKIDRGFVNGIDHGREEFALATAILKLAASLGKETIAEGVETPGQAAHLRALHCRLAQGYLFSKPLPPGDLETLLASSSGPDRPLLATRPT